MPRRHSRYVGGMMPALPCGRDDARQFRPTSGCGAREETSHAEHVPPDALGIHTTRRGRRRAIHDGVGGNGGGTKITEAFAPVSVTASRRINTASLRSRAPFRRHPAAPACDTRRPPGVEGLRPVRPEQQSGVLSSRRHESSAPLNETSSGYRPTLSVISFSRPRAPHLRGFDHRVGGRE